MPHIDKLIARAKKLSNGRNRNQGRPRLILDETIAGITSKMRKSGCSVQSIYKVLAEEKMTDIPNYQRFQTAYDNYKLHA